jgi:hypothetical protein
MFRFLELNGLASHYLNKDLVKMRVGGISTRNIKSTYMITKETYLYFKNYGIKLNLIKYLFFKFIKMIELIKK